MYLNPYYSYRKLISIVLRYSIVIFSLKILKNPNLNGNLSHRERINFIQKKGALIKRLSCWVGYGPILGLKNYSF